MLKPGDLVVCEYHICRFANIEIVKDVMLIDETNKHIIYDQKFINGVVEIMVRVPEGYLKIWGSKPW